MSDRSARPVVLTIANGKGGVGKTSLATNLAAEAAMRGLRTVLVDLDPQGNTSLDLGVYEHDAGRALGSAVSYDSLLTPTPTTRPGLWWIPAGEATAVLHATLTQLEARNGPAGLAKLRSVLWPLSDTDLIVIDTPPAQSNRPVIDAALMASDWVLIPTRHDAGSILGIGDVVQRLRAVSEAGLSSVQALGVVLFGLASASKALRVEAATELREGLGDITLFESVVRTSERAAYDLRDRGLVAGEYAAAAKAASGDRFKALRLGRGTRELQRFATNAHELAADYHSVTDEALRGMGFGAVKAGASA
jgi:cellulose biosynthesis protein BcsQ